VPPGGGTQIGANGIERQGTQSGRGNGKSEGWQPGLGRGGRVVGAELPAGKADLGGIRAGGAKRFQQGNCGRRSNRAYEESFRGLVLARVRERYEDFGPTLASEHLASGDGLSAPAETLRRWMMQAGLWPGQRRQPYRRRREPKAHLGELVELDGSL
jgi:hypothetical protein